ncbi:hypothetical protein, partial [Leptolyngbya sp. FACHB-711]|uniref:hypothetical protein n=1 Tax=Leptolyngbya sp. FACHB-711 TaxID=2692813 RepID=UPI00168834D4
LGESFSGAVGVQFNQQKRGKEGVPDGEIVQTQFSKVDNATDLAAKPAGKIWDNYASLSWSSN